MEWHPPRIKHGHGQLHQIEIYSWENHLHYKGGFASHRVIVFRFLRKPFWIFSSHDFQMSNFVFLIGGVRKTRHSHSIVTMDVMNRGANPPYQTGPSIVTKRTLGTK